MRIYYVRTYDLVDEVQCVHQRAWAADWCAWKAAVEYFKRDTLNPEGPEWRIQYVSDPWAGYPGWAFGPYSSEAYSYAVPVRVDVP